MMSTAIAQFAVEAIGQRVGVAVRADMHADHGMSMDLYPTDFHRHESFSVHFEPGWRIAEATFIPGKFAAPLIVQMGRTAHENRSAFTALASALESRKTRLLFRVNGIDLLPTDATTWPPDWNRFELQARSAPQVIDQADVSQMRQLVIDMVIPLFAMIAALVGVEEEESPSMNVADGRPIQSLITRYERKKVNREACIQLKGAICAACGFDFRRFYGSLGVGYIEVHHAVPVSQMEPDYHLNIATDLEPLCANCHAMVHRKDPPIAVGELREIIRTQRG